MSKIDYWGYLNFREAEMSDEQKDETIAKLSTEVNELRQYKIDTEKKLAIMQRNIEVTELTIKARSEDYDELKRKFERTEAEYRALLEDKQGIEKGVLKLIEKYGKEVGKPA